MSFPNTPVTLLARLEERENGVPNQQAWESFFDLYHGAIRMTVKGAFLECGWHTTPEDVLEDTISDVVVSFYKGGQSFDPEKGKFRNYLRQLARWRVRDQLAKSLATAEKVLKQGISLPDDDHPSALTSNTASPDEVLNGRDIQEYRDTLLATLLEDVRQRVGPQTFAIFELCKLQGQTPDEVAAFFKVKRNAVDNAVYRVTRKLKELAAQPEYRKEYFE